MRNIKLLIAYDGRNYLGWQKTRTGPSIEGSLKNAIEQIVQHPVELQAASRTDAGVHASGQVVNFLTPKIRFSINRFRISLNSLLPEEIVVLNAEEMPFDFHPTLDCIGKEYRYYLCLGQTQFPQYRFYSWHIPWHINLNRIDEALPYLTGTHNFATFCNAKKNARYSDYIREIHLLECLEYDNGRLCVRIRGNHFLYKMVRSIVGTLVNIGSGKISIDALPQILKMGQRSRAGVTAPPHGLFLHEVFY